MPDPNQNPPNPGTQPSAADQAAAEKKRAEEEAAAEKKRLDDHEKAERSNWVTVQKGDETLRINIATVAAHLAAGWKVAK